MSTLGSSSHPFFDPLWRRVLLIAFLVGWTLTELYFQSYAWAMIVGVFTLYGAWSYLIDYKLSTEFPAGDAAQKKPNSGE